MVTSSLFLMMMTSLMRSATIRNRTSSDSTFKMSSQYPANVHQLVVPDVHQLVEPDAHQLPLLDRILVSCVMDVMAPYLAHVSSAQSVQTMISAHPVEVQDSTMNINSQAFRIHLSRCVYDFVLD